MLVYLWMLYGVAVFCVYQLATIVYNFWFHPLSKYPGPKLWAISRLPYAISLSTGNLVHDTWRIHEKYGKVVRLAPNELSFIQKQAMYDIYGTRRGHDEFVKNPAWIRTAPNGAWSILDSPEDVHTRQRKILNYAFSGTALRSQEPFVHKYISMLIERAYAHEVLDLKDWYNFTTFDITGDLTFGKSFKCLELGKYHRWVAHLFAHLKASCLLASITFYPSVMNILWLLMPKSAFNERLYHFKKAVKWVHRRLAMETERADFMSYIIDNNTGNTMTVEEIEATAGTLVIAGSETSSTVLTSTTLNLMLQPDKLAKLTQEIRSSFNDESEITAAAVHQLPYLTSVLQENFRYTPPVPCSIPRVVPLGGDTIAQEHYPEKTFVGFPQLPAYRSPHYFAHPHHFIPERWLSPTSPHFTPTPSDPPYEKDTFSCDERSIVQPFSVGPRQCIAQALGRMETELILARLLWHFDFEFPGGEKERGVRGRRPWVAQKTFGLWVKESLGVRLVPVGKGRG